LNMPAASHSAPRSSRRPSPCGPRSRSPYNSTKLAVNRSLRYVSPASRSGFAPPSWRGSPLIRTGGSIWGSAASRTEARAAGLEQVGP
jgi:hypothetical protein